MRSTLLALTTLAGLLAGCAGPRAAAPARAADRAGPATYFPLAAGNSWTWEDRSSGNAPGQVPLRTVTIRERTADGYWKDSDGNELRAGADCVQDRVRRLLCAPLEAGRTWSSVVSVSSTERYEIAGTGEAVETPAGRFERCVRVRAHNRAGPATDYVNEITYAPGVGPVRIETYAVVDGKVTPQVRALLRSYRIEGK